MKNVLVIAPHADDETLGCGGTLLRHKKDGDAIHWLLATSMTKDAGFSAEAISTRDSEIEKVAKTYDFASTTKLGFAAKNLDTISLSDVIDKMAACFKQLQPHILFLPFGGDAHTDHHVIFEAAAACTKWFRFPTIEKVLAYETISETDAALPGQTPFVPNLFVDISGELAGKIEIMKMYKTEMGKFPFPRSPEAIEALAKLRGAASGYSAAESFQILRERR